MNDVFKFLLGEGPLNGVWFGERPEGERGDFWWRKHLRAEVERLTNERDELRAARIAYANEFQPNKDGEPDVGNIHANIRALKKERVALRSALNAMLTFYGMDEEPGEASGVLHNSARRALEEGEE